MPATNKRFIAYDETPPSSGAARHPNKPWKTCGAETTQPVAQKSGNSQSAALETAPATAALIQEFEERGGQLAWGELSDGTHCTLDEANDAERDGRA